MDVFRYHDFRQFLYMELHGIQTRKRTVTVMKRKRQLRAAEYHGFDAVALLHRVNMVKQPLNRFVPNDSELQFMDDPVMNSFHFAVGRRDNLNAALKERTPEKFFFHGESRAEQTDSGKALPYCFFADGINNAD